MRCIHCYKEVRENQVFCTNCGRPVSKRYEKCTSEIYDGFSWGSLISKLPDSEKKPLKKTTYTKSKQTQTQAAPSMRIREVDEEQDEIKKYGKQAPAMFESINASNTAKVIISVTLFVIFILPTIIALFAGLFSLHEPRPEFENNAMAVLEHYELPAAEDSYVKDSADMENAIEGSSRLVREYLTMIHSMMEYLLYEPVKSRETPPPYTLEEIDDYMSRMDEVSAYYESGESFSEVYWGIVKLHREWKVWIYPDVAELLNDYKMTELDGVEVHIYEYFDNEELSSFWDHVVHACQGYLIEK